MKSYGEGMKKNKAWLEGKQIKGLQRLERRARRKERKKGRGGLKVEK